MLELEIVSLTDLDIDVSLIMFLASNAWMDVECVNMQDLCYV